MRFSQFYAGQVISAGPVEISEEEITNFARAFDPQWFHTDVNRAAEGRWKGLIASGWHTCAIAMKLVYQAALSDSESFGSPGLSYVRWRNPVRPGDNLTLKCHVIDANRSPKKPDIGQLKWRWQLYNQADQEVLDLEVLSLFDLVGES